MICSVVHYELERAQRLCEATKDTEHWLAAVALNDALTEFYRSDRRIYEAAREVGVSDQQWHALKHGTDERRSTGR